MHWHQLKALGSPAFLCHSPEEFIDAIKQAINNNEINTVKTFAESADWTDRLNEVLAILPKAMYK